MKSRNGANTWRLQANFCAVAATAIFWFPKPASADDATCAQREQQGLAGNPASVVIPQLAGGCYGVAEEQHPLTQKIFSLLDQTPARESLALALRTLAMSVKSDDVYGEDRAPRISFADSAEDAAVGIGFGALAGESGTSPVAWQFDQGKAPAVEGLDVIAILSARCPDTQSSTSDACQSAIATVKAWLRAVQLAETALSRYAAPALEELQQLSAARLAMWHAYRDEALPQYPWEWLINSARLNKADQGPSGRLRDGDGQPIGPMNVPTDQLIVLHPGVGLEYRSEPDEIAAASESKTKPIVYLELIGRYRWGWDESTGRMRGGAGVSLVATYADRDEDTEVGYGLLFHTRRSKAYTFGVTRSGDATNIIFNADFAEFFKDKLSYWKGVEEQAAK